MECIRKSIHAKKLSLILLDHKTSGLKKSRTRVEQEPRKSFANDFLGKIYLPGGYRIGSDPKKGWFDEFNTGINIDRNWAYVDLKKNKIT